MRCSKCNKKLKKGGKRANSPSRHHVHPVRWFGKGKKNRIKVLFCNECHRELETIIRRFEERIIAIMMKQKRLLKRPSKQKQIRIFRSMKQIYLQMVNDYVN